MKLDERSLPVRLFYLFLAADMGFMILHLVYSYSGLTGNYNFSLGSDRGYSEVFQYIKEYWIALLLGSLAVRKRSFLYLSWSLLFFYLMLDDFIEIHERVGAFIGVRLAFTSVFSLRAEDLGELIVSASVGSFFLLCIAISYRFGDRASRKASRNLLIMLLALAGFGIVVDMLHIILESPLLEPLLTLVEDGGELVVMSLIATFAFWLSEHSQSETDRLKVLSKKIPLGILHQE